MTYPAGAPLGAASPPKPPADPANDRPDQQPQGPPQHPQAQQPQHAPPPAPPPHQAPAPPMAAPAPAMAPVQQPMAPAPMAPMPVAAAPMPMAPQAPMAQPGGAMTMPGQDPAEMSIERHLGPLRSELAARFQAIESTLASLAQKPGEAPGEVTMRQQASALEAAANDKERQALEYREAANVSRQRALSAGTSEAGVHHDTSGSDLGDTGDAKETISDQLEADAVEKQSIADQLECESTEMRAEAAVLRAKAYGFYPVLMAVATLITDEGVKNRKMLTDMGAEISTVKKLVTDGGVGSAPGQGGKANVGGGGKKDVSATTAPPQPQRRSMSASAQLNSFLKKFPDLEASGERMTTAQLDEAFANAHLTLQQRIALKTELSGLGRLR